MLHDAMNAHPEISKPPRGLHYFSEQYDLGEDWYAGEIPPPPDRGIALEFSVSYSYPEHSEAAAERIAKAAPGARLLAVVRNPTERAFSDYLRSVLRCEIDRGETFESALTNHPALLERGRYFRLLSPYLDRFPRERIGVFFLEDLATNPSEFWRRLWRYLGVDPSFRPPLQTHSIGRRSVRMPRLNRALHATKQACDSVAAAVGGSQLWERVKGRGRSSYQKVVSWNTTETGIEPTTRARLVDYYAEDAARLTDWTGYSPVAWSA